MGWYTVDACFEAECPSGTDKAVLLAIAHLKNEKTGACYATRETISKLSSVSQISVTRAIKELVKCGHLTTGKKSDGHGYIYTFSFSEAIQSRAKDKSTLVERGTSKQRSTTVNKAFWDNSSAFVSNCLERAEREAWNLSIGVGEVNESQTVQDLRNRQISCVGE